MVSDGDGGSSSGVNAGEGCYLNPKPTAAGGVFAGASKSGTAGEDLGFRV